MKLPQTPLELAQTAAAGCILIFISGICSLIPFPGLPEHYKLYELLYHGRWEVIVPLLPFAAGLGIAYFFQNRLSQGIRRQVWTGEQVDQARAWLEAPAVTWTLVINFLFIAIAALVSSMKHHHAGGWFFFMLASNPITLLRQTLRKPARPSQRIDWTSTTPIHSDHWGNPA